MYPRYLLVAKDHITKFVLYSKRFKSIDMAIRVASGFYADFVDLECTDVVFDRNIDIEEFIAEFEETSI